MAIATNIEIGKLIKKMFMGYDRYCFTMGNYTQETKKTARYITDEIYSCDYDIDIVRKAVRSARDESTKKPPTLTEILIKCNRIRRHLEIVESNRLYEIKKKKDDVKFKKNYKAVPKEELEQRVAEGDPYDKIILGREFK